MKKEYKGFYVSDKVRRGHGKMHKSKCKYVKNILNDNLLVLTEYQASTMKYCSCKYCSGFAGDINLNKSVLDKYSNDNNFSYKFINSTNTLYVDTGTGFWKIVVSRRSGAYLLYHRNVYVVDSSFADKIEGAFHIQSDVKNTYTLMKVIHYIVNHDKAKKTSEISYKYLPRNTKKQRKYYELAKRKEKTKARIRVYNIFADWDRNKRLSVV